jgi:hypothetical protein
MLFKQELKLKLLVIFLVIQIESAKYLEYYNLYMYKINNLFIQCQVALTNLYCLCKLLQAFDILFLKSFNLTSSLYTDY